MPADAPMAIRKLEANASPEAVTSFIDSHSFPLVEKRSVTFVYRGAADGVYFMPMIYGLPRRKPLQQLGGTDIWYLTLELPESARVEYKFEVERNGHAEWVDDPLNPRRTFNPFGQNSVVHALGYRTPEWTQPDDAAPAGTLEEVLLPSNFLRGIRRVTIYLPSGPQGRPLSLCVVHDGGDYLRFGGISTVLDNLIHRGEMAPAVVALSHPEERLHEYAANRAHAAFITEELLPWVAARFAHAGKPVLMGASMGAVATLHTADSYPGRYAALLLQSGTFAPRAGGGAARRVLEPVVRFLRGIDPSRLPRPTFLSCGRYERLVEENRAMAERLRQAGLDVMYAEAPDGHAWEGWRDRLREGFAWVLPPTGRSRPPSPAVS